MNADIINQDGKIKCPYCSIVSSILEKEDEYDGAIYRRFCCNFCGKHFVIQYKFHQVFLEDNLPYMEIT